MTAGAVEAYAYSDNDFAGLVIRQADGFCTVITDTEGDTHTYSGTIDAKSIESCGAAEKISEYKIYRGDNEIISVKLNDIVSEGTLGIAEVGKPVVNGYYSVRFELSADDNTEVFLTGLSDSNIDMVQEELINAQLNNKEFEMESLDFIDCEKTDLPNDGDDELCWAASASNILHYTGWGEKAGFDSEDDILDCFRDSFDDKPGNTFFAYEWFLNGTNTAQYWDDWAHVKDYGKSGGFLKQYSSNSVTKDVDFSSDYKKFNQVTSDLENGWGASLSIGWVDQNYQRNSGHALSIWGYICDKDFENSDAEYYRAIVVSDSDSNQKADSNRRTAPNNMTVLTITPYRGGGYNTWSFDGYGGAVLERVFLLIPYSDTLQYETDKDATMDKFSTLDMVVSEVYASNDNMDKNMMMEVCAESDIIYVAPVIKNSAEVDFRGKVQFTVTAIDNSDGSTKLSKTYIYSAYLPAHNGIRYRVPFGSLQAGEYTIEVAVNSGKTIKEAYYYNNAKEYPLTVSDKKYDLRSVNLSADIDEFIYGNAQAMVTMDGFDTLGYPEKADYCFFVSYFNDGKWGEWELAEEIDASSINSGLVTTVQLRDSGTKVKFRLVAEAPNVPLLNIYSAVYDLRYKKINVTADSNNNYTPIGRAAKSLADGETISFSLSNDSSYDCGTISCSAVVYAVRNNERIELYREDNIELNYGAEPYAVSCDSWESNLSGTYDIVACAESDFGDKEMSLGTLYVEEQTQLEVTTSDDTVDKYDGEISLREAVAYLSEMPGGKITFSSDTNPIFLQSPITIESSVKMEGHYDASMGNYVIIFGGNNTQLFKVTGTGVLEGEMLNLYSGYSEDCGGAVENNGGTVKLNNCFMLFCTSEKGGGIYTNGGKVNLSNCSIKGNRAGYGGAIAVDGNAELSLIGCNIIDNSSNTGAIYNNSGNAVIIHSTLINNAAEGSGGGAVTSTGTTSIFGSIAVLNGVMDIEGKTNVYGSYVTSVGKDTTLDEFTVQDIGKKLFACYEDGSAMINVDKNNGLICYKATLSSAAAKGVYVKNIDGCIAYSADNKEWIKTDIPATFEDNLFENDTFGNSRGNVFGSQTEMCGDYKILDISNGNAYIFAPDETDAVLAEKFTDYDDVLTNVNIYEPSLDTGTNIVELENAENDVLRCYYLWNNLNEMKPLAERW